VTRHPDPTVATVKGSCTPPQRTAPTRRVRSRSIARFRRSRPLRSTPPSPTYAQRAPAGPRFDELMTSAENRSGSNLILLCRFHASLVDAKGSDFSVDQLREWKARQLEQGGGTPITDDQAREVIRASITTEISMQAEVINVGGQWGGGGGAVGAGAVGGPGGDQIRLNRDGVAPGGGGGVVVGPGGTPPMRFARRKARDSARARTAAIPTYITDSEGNVLLLARGGSAGLSDYDQRGTTRSLSVHR
jgi:hypothetical protein